MKTIIIPHDVDPQKLKDVANKMKTLGSPTIRVVDCGDHYVALEGCHRLKAANELGIAPKLIVLEQDDIIESDSLDWQGLYPGETYTAGELAYEAYSPHAQAITFYEYTTA